MNNTGKLKPFVSTRAQLRGIVANVIGATVGVFDNDSYYMCYAAKDSDIDDNENILRLNNRVRTLWKKVGSFGTTATTGRFIYARDPLLTDDLLHGFGVFNEWLNQSSGEMFICTANTPNAATWEKIQYIHL